MMFGELREFGLIWLYHCYRKRLDILEAPLEKGIGSSLVELDDEVEKTDVTDKMVLREEETDKVGGLAVHYPQVLIKIKFGQ